MAQTRAATDTRILQTRSYSIFGRQANETYSLRSGSGWSRGEKPCLRKLRGLEPISMPATATKRIAERYVGPLNEWQTAHAIAAVRANVSELVSAADALAAVGIYSKSCALSILAVEESQKVSMLLSLLYADTPEEQREIYFPT